MKFSIGDIVLLKRTGEEGKVVSFVNQDMIEVEVEGTHFPVFLDEVDHPYLKWFTEKKKVMPAPKKLEDFPPEPKQAAVGQGVANGFHLSFLPVYRFDEFEDVVDKLKTYFINQMPYELSLQYECSLPGGSLFAHKTVLQPFSHFYLHDIPFEKMHEQPRFSWILSQNDIAVKAGSLSDTLRIKPKKLFEFISTAQKLNNPMFHVKLAEDFPLPDPLDRPGKRKAEGIAPPKDSVDALIATLKTPRKEKLRQEIDLHIEQLVRSTVGLSNYEMLTIQLKAFEKALDEAIELHQLSLVVIHGVGKGKLKEEIHLLLKTVPEVEFFQHEWNPRYGYGATEVFFRQ